MISRQNWMVLGTVQKAVLITQHYLGITFKIKFKIIYVHTFLSNSIFTKKKRPLQSLKTLEFKKIILLQ